MSRNHDRERYLTAHHEAAHVVLHVGAGDQIRWVDMIPVPAKNVLDGPRSGYTATRIWLGDLIKSLPATLAGDTAMRKLGARVRLASDERLEDFFRECLKDYDLEDPVFEYDDIEHAAFAVWWHFYREPPILRNTLRWGNVVCDDAEKATEFLIARYREADRFTSRLVRRADVWASIEAVAEALLASETGRLEGDQATALVPESTRYTVDALINGFLGKWWGLRAPPVRLVDEWGNPLPGWDVMGLIGGVGAE